VAAAVADIAQGAATQLAAFHRVEDAAERLTTGGAAIAEAAAAAEDAGREIRGTADATRNEIDRVLRALLDARLASFRRDRQGALKLLSVGESPRDARLDAVELAAWTTVASAILNLDETLTKQ
jgi:hypothetical protein